MENGEKKGFTIVEFLMVILILGIVAAIAIPRLTLRSGPPGSKASLDEYTISESGEIEGNQFNYEHWPGQWDIEISGPDIGFRYAHYDKDANAPPEISEWRVKILKKLGYL